MSDDGLLPVPGFTVEQSLGLRAVARQTAEEMRESMASARDMEEVRCTLYGNGSPGLKSLVGALKKDVDGLVWWNRLLVGAVATTLIAMIIQAVR